MVLESLISPTLAKRRPHEVFLFGGFSATIGLFLSYWVFQQYSSLIMVFLITLASVPLLYFTIKSEEQVDVDSKTERSMLLEHSKVLTFLLFLFMGISMALSFWYVVLPSEMVSTLFSSQSQTIVDINNKISGSSIHMDVVFRIFFNNIRVLVFAILFAFLYGVGAIFILTWNASVIGAAVGNFVRKNVAASAELIGLNKLANYLSIFSFGIFRYIIHGIPEIAAYFVGGLAGGIISMAVIKQDLFHEKRDKIMFDSAELVLIAVGLLMIAAMIEVYVTPWLF